ncbi:hypothetical protein ABTX60_28565 [Streptomyces sp. NPDC126510]|uniref:hypothetical protein n=1 Tax=Streptomyces sp. NPDC126510 TaxID=3155317 RepID=UPI00332AE494
MKTEPASQRTLEHFHLTLQAAAAGVGIAIAPYAVARDDLDRDEPARERILTSVGEQAAAGDEDEASVHSTARLAP